MILINLTTINPKKLPKFLRNCYLKGLKVSQEGKFLKVENE